MSLLYKLFFIASFVFAVIISLLSDYIILHLYGRAYTASSGILRINIWAGVFVFLGVISSNYYIIEGLNKISFAQTALGAITNILLNFFLIPLYGGLGAAIATLIAYAIVVYFSNLVFKQTRPLFRWMSKSILYSLNLKEC